MPMYVRLPRIDLAPIDELIAARRLQWKEHGTPQSLALNKSGILIISALLQGYVEEVFFSLSKYLLPHLRDEDLGGFRRSVGNWGNPNADNIERLFSRIGVVAIIDGVKWQKTDPQKIRAHLKSLNELRNQIAHGKPLRSSLKLAHVEEFRDFVEQFAANLDRCLVRRFRQKLVRL